MSGWLAMSNGLESNLLLVLPLVVFVAVGLWAWSALERWIAEAVERGEERDAS